MDKIEFELLEAGKQVSAAAAKFRSHVVEIKRYDAALGQEVEDLIQRLGQVHQKLPHVATAWHGVPR